MRLLLLGCDGQVGRALQQALPALGQLVALGRHGAPGLCGDLADSAGLAATVRRVRPRVIVNAAAYTAVDDAEREPGLAQRINAEAPSALAHAAAACDALLVHYSSDYVFGGSGQRPWREDDTPAPCNAYGRSKRAGEQAVASAGCRHLILRTSWVHAAQGRNFVTTVLERARAGQALAAVDHTWGAPTPAKLVAQATAALIPQVLAHAGKQGLYHLAARGFVTPLGWARQVLACARPQWPQAASALRGLRSTPGPLPGALALRPRNCRLDTQHIRAVFGLELPRWESGVADTVARWLAASGEPVPCT